MTAEHRAGLIEAALSVRQRAYAPYSKFLVGAAILSDDGVIVVGCNVENASYGLTQCAERSAVTAFVAGGHSLMKGIALASSGAVPPCGACRQVLAEFARELPILLVDANNSADIRETTLDRLFPQSFRLRVDSSPGT